MSFREKEQRMTEELTRECNAVVDYYKAVFSEISAATTGIDADTSNAAAVRKHADELKKTLSKLNFQ
jgi:hypothetical protein